MTLDELITHAHPVTGIVFLALCVCVVRVLYGFMEGTWSDDDE